MNSVAERDRSIGLLRLATRRDPNFPMAHVMLAGFLAISVMTQFSRNSEDIGEALKHADKALELAPDNPLVMHGAVTPHRLFGNEVLAMDLATRAKAATGSDAMLGPRAPGDNLSACLIQTGREQEAIALMLNSKPVPEMTLATAYAVQGNWSESLAWAQRSAATAPYFFLAWINVANALAMLDRMDEAKEVMVRVKTLVPTFTLAHYEKGTRIGWRNRERVVEASLAGLRKLAID